MKKKIKPKQTKNVKTNPKPKINYSKGAKWE
jgi:hypothetical protein